MRCGVGQADGLRGWWWRWWAKANVSATRAVFQWRSEDSDNANVPAPDRINNVLVMLVK